MIRFSLASTVALLVVLPTFAADWPQWRGPDRTGISADKNLLQEWPKDGPKLRWKITDLGTGYSAPAIVKGVVYIQTTRKGEEFAVALDEKDGKEKWATKIGKVGANRGPQYPGTRATPTVDGDKLYCLASDGELNCVDTAGKVIWHKNLAKDFDGAVGSWAYTESVLIDGDALICTPGGKTATLAALKKETGDVIWKSEVPGGDIADYASIMIVEAAGRKQYVQYMRKALVGVDAKTGKFLWKYTATQDQGASMLTPVVYKDTVFVAGARTGGGLVALKPETDGVSAKEVYFDKAVAPGIGGAVLLDGYLYGFSGANLFCAEFATGKVQWKEASVGASALCYADGRLYVRGQKGEVALVEANPKMYVEKGRFAQPERTKTPAWPHPVVANGGLYLRDMDVLLCYDVAAKK
jgi:outer membrane protein assembly factor BamB